METREFAADLDRILEVKRFSDDVSNNGLQIENNGSITKVCTGVDASLRFFEEAAARGADAVVVHHGISWGNSLNRITGLNYRQVKAAMNENLALYAVHLPLDAHPELGNNARLAALFGLEDREPFFDYHGHLIGFKGALPEALSLECVMGVIHEKINPEAQLLPFGKKRIRRIGIVSGGASEGVTQAFEEELDLYLTGESGLVGYNLAEQLGMTTVFAGHYATERFGVQAVGDLIARTWGLPVEHIDFSIPF